MAAEEMEKEEWRGRLAAGLLTDLAVILGVIGVVCHNGVLAFIGGAGFFIACSPALIAGPLAVLFGIYLALQPVCLVVENIRRHQAGKRDL